ncbi:MAG: MMPL family transporter, partial [Tomitella sp.]|nr:MMPL family transporter [Tomitella sp.]
NNSAAWLPESAESAHVMHAITEMGGGQTVAAVVVAERGSGITEADTQFVAGVLESTAGTGGFGDEVLGPLPSGDGRAVVGGIEVVPDDQLDPEIGRLRAALSDGVPEGLSVHIGGEAGMVADLTDAIAGIDGLLLLVAGAVVMAILIVVYRSPILPVVVLLSAVGALAASSLVVYALVDGGIVDIDAQSQGIMFILVFGAATDYALLLVARYREELGRTADRFLAMRRAWRATIEPVAASGGTVILGLLCMLLSDLGSNRSLGPIATVGIVGSLLATMTLLPAMLVLIGRRVYWPTPPKLSAELGSAPATSGFAAPQADHRHAEDRVVAADHPRWWSLAQSIRRHPRRYWAGALIGLFVLAAFAPQFRAGGVPQTDMFMNDVDSKIAQQVIGEHFPAGASGPAVIVADAATAPQVAAAVAGVVGVATVQTVNTADGLTEIDAILTDAPDSDAALNTVDRLRTAVHAVPDADAMVGGVSAIQLDVRDTSVRDRTLIIPVVLAVVLAVLMLLLRSIVAPVMLMLTVVLSFASALGVSALVFNHVLDFPGADPAMPLFAFVFLVALGIDYNIFLMTRVREESLRHGTAAGVPRGLAVTGGVITSAGVVLAATFASLSVIPLLFLAQIAFIVAFGVLLDTIVVRSLLVPA